MQRGIGQHRAGAAANDVGRIAARGPDATHSERTRCGQCLDARGIVGDDTEVTLGHQQRIGERGRGLATNLVDRDCRTYRRRAGRADRSSQCLDGRAVVRAHFNRTDCCVSPLGGSCARTGSVESTHVAHCCAGAAVDVVGRSRSGHCRGRCDGPGNREILGGAGTAGRHRDRAVNVNVDVFQRGLGVVPDARDIDGRTDRGRLASGDRARQGIGLGRIAGIQ